MSTSYGRLNASGPKNLFPALKAAMPAGLSFIVWWELLSAALGVVAIFAIFLFSDFVVNPFILVPVPFVLVWLASAYGFNQQKRWAWKLGMATAVLSLLISPILLGPFVVIMFLPWIIVWPCSIIYLTTPHPKGFLGKITGPENPARTRAANHRGCVI